MSGFGSSWTQELGSAVNRKHRTGGWRTVGRASQDLSAGTLSKGQQADRPQTSMKQPVVAQVGSGGCRPTPDIDATGYER